MKLSVLLVTFISVVDSARRNREFVPLKLEKCATKTPMEIVINLNKTNVNVVGYNGHVIVKEEISGDMDLILETHKCSLDMKTCEKYTNFNIGKMCERFEQQNTFYTPVFGVIEPPFRCPLKAGNYSLTQSSIDLSIYAFLGLDGYVWMIKFKVVSVNSETKLKKLLMCVNLEVKINKTNKKAPEA